MSEAQGLPAAADMRGVAQTAGLWGVLAVWAVSWGCGSPEQTASAKPGESGRAALVGGAPDPGHPAVGYVLSDGGACTGTLVTPSMVLTAAHCATAQHPPKLFLLGASAAQPGTVIDVVQAKQHWGYDPETQGDPALGQPNDIALLQLAQPAPVPPVLLGVAAMDCLEGTPVTYVGFGMTDGKIPDSGGNKMSLDTVIGTVVSTGFWSHTIPGAPKNACPGDSGGPVLEQKGVRTEVVAVLSLADKWCESETFAVRLDIHKGWLFSTLKEQDPEGLAAFCGNGFCDYLEDVDGCPADCVAGALGPGDACAADKACAAELLCVEDAAAGTGKCATVCPASGTGTGCPCGFVCVPAADAPEGAGACVATGYGQSNCGNKVCEPGESHSSCAFDCVVPACGLLDAAGCCNEETAAWCKDGIMLMQNCAGADKCGWDAVAGRYSCGTAGQADPDGAHPMDCPPPPAVCGNGVCEKDESQESCPIDCLYPGYCGDGVCNGYEDYAKCEADCRKGLCELTPEKGCCDGEVAVWCAGGDQLKWSCQHHPQCGWDPELDGYGCATDGAAEPSGQFPRECAAYVEKPCGNGKCDKDESYETCPEDCEPPLVGCGDGACAAGEDYTVCPADCSREGCGKILEQGCCEGDVLKWCIGDTLFMVNCGNDPSCGWSVEDGYYWCGTDGVGEPEGKHPLSCEVARSSLCGDGLCLVGEDEFLCPEDCTPEVVEECGDGVCSTSESTEVCPGDCPALPVEPESEADVPGPLDVQAPEMQAELPVAEEPPPASSGSGGCALQPGAATAAHVFLAVLLVLCAPLRLRNRQCARLRRYAVLPGRPRSTR